MEILSKLAYGGRGMEMSTLANYNDEVYACDDKTGVVYQLPIAGSERIVPIPWAILADGDFEGPKGLFPNFGVFPSAYGCGGVDWQEIIPDIIQD